ncbi:hypothetical protein [Pontibacter korlensis]|nr:hypothetical protein [Pontibacter korlensis]
MLITIDTDKIDIVILLIICVPLIQLTLIQFLDNWHKYQQPFLLDWFRLASFLSLVLNFLILIPYFEGQKVVLVHNVVYVSTEYILPALLVILIGLLGLQIGQVLLQRNALLRRSERIQNFVIEFRNLKLFYLVSAVFIVIELFLILRGDIGYGSTMEQKASSLSFIVQALQIAVPFFLVTLSIVKYKFNISDFRFNCFFYTLLSLQILIGFFSGMKEEIITPIVLISIPYILSGRLIRKELFSICIIFIVLLYPINNQYRFVQNNQPEMAKSDAFKLAMLQIIEDGLSESLETGADSYQGRISLFPIFLYSIQEEPNWKQYKYFDRYAYIPFAWIVPRFFLPSKPTADTGKKFYYMTTGNKSTSITPSTFGWAFFEGGYAPVFIAFFIFGMFVMLVEVFFRPYTFLGLIIYSTVLISMLKVEADIYFRISGILQTILIGLIYVNIFFKIQKIYFIQHEM